MKMYKETMRRLAPVGIPLAIATLLYTVITTGQSCFGVYTISTSMSAIGLTPVLVYYVFSAIVFAFYGFSYLFKRSASDLYHSLPVSRMSLYLSVSLSTATWMGFTIVLNMLVTLFMYLISGCSFVPLYIPLLILFYFVAAMLVFAASAIGCALSGTYITALASTGLVLFLPRFVQFIMAHGVINNVPIIGWADLGVWLSPDTNIATGLIVMQSRNIFITRIVTLPHILYSLLLAAIELVIAAWLFVRRPSEVADKSAKHSTWPVITASLLAFTLLILITLYDRRLISVYGIAIVAIALLLFVVYTLLSLRSYQKALKALPAFAIAAVLAFGVSFGIQTLKDHALNVTPSADEIASVTFRGHDSTGSNNEYATLLIKDIAFTSDDIKQYVAENLSNAVQQIRDPENYYQYNGYDSYQYQTIEPITLKLTNGKTYYRTIEFINVNTLNDLRTENADFAAAIRAFPPSNGVQYVSTYNHQTDEEDMALWNSYEEEMQANGLIPNDYYNTRASVSSDDGFMYTVGDSQSISGFIVSGYVGTQRYYDYLSILLNTPKTVSLMMRTINNHALPDTIDRLSEAVEHIVSPLALENDSLSLSLNFYNVPLETGETHSDSINLYLSGYSKANSPYADTYLDYAERITDILKRAKPTSDVNGMFACLNWYEYDGSNNLPNDEPPVYLSFTDEDSQTLITLLQEWNQSVMYMY